MRHSTRRIATFGACLLALSAGACNKGPAAEALEAAEQALTAAPEVERYEPEEFAAVSGIIRDARASYAAGRYTDALRAVQPLPDRIAAAAAAAAKQKEQTAATWSALSEELKARLEALTARLTLLSSAEAISSERLAAAQAELATLHQAWADASVVYERGDVPNAVAAAQDLKARAESLASRLGLKPAPAAADPARGNPAPSRSDDRPAGASLSGSILGGMRIKTSITIDERVLRAIDKATSRHRSRSRVIEDAAREFLARRSRAAREARDLGILNEAADALNREMDDVLAFQADV